MDDNENLTTQNDWDAVWKSIRLPAIVDFNKKRMLNNEILKVLDSILPRGDKITALEIGGAPGQYAVFMHRHFGYQVSTLDFSNIGTEKTKENFALLGISAKVYNGDLFADDLPIAKHDIVYSFGFIEHFQTVDRTIEHHLKYLRPGGYLIVGTPNFQGINNFIMKIVAPRLLAQHNVATMNIALWESFEKACKLTTIFKSYIGGFDAGAVNQKEKMTILSVFVRTLLFAIQAVDYLFLRHLKILRKINSRFFSGYAIAIYRYNI